MLGLVLFLYKRQFLVLVVPHFAKRIRRSGLRAGTKLAIADIVEVAFTIAGAIRYKTLFL